MGCLKRERDISIKPMLSGGKMGFNLQLTTIHVSGDG